MIRRICVFCGSSAGHDPAFIEAARTTGKVLAERDIGLVYGGGSVGLMGEVADAVLAAGGEAIGVIPRALWDREIGHRGLTKIHIVETMHERKAMMSSLSDAFLALPGGLGTYEEMFEVWTWAQLGMHEKPCGFLDVNGFYAPLMSFLDSAVASGFIRGEHRAMAIIDRDIEKLIDRFSTYEPPRVVKWVRKGEE